MIFSCANGHKLHGAPSVHCSILGEWGAEQPTCKCESPVPSHVLYSFSSSVVTCGIPGYVEHGQTVGFGHSFGDSVVTTCKPGFKLVGSPRRSCLSNGTWSGVKPSCQGKIVHPSCSHLFSPRGNMYTDIRP